MRFGPLCDVVLLYMYGTKGIRLPYSVEIRGSCLLKWPSEMFQIETFNEMFFQM